MNKEKEPLLKILELRKYFDVEKKTLKAVDHVSFNVIEGETLGLVGESGCGKTTLGRTLMRLYQPTGGEVFFEGKSILNLTKQENKALSQKIQYIFQDPFSSLNPRMTAGETIIEPFKIHRKLKTSSEREIHLDELLNLVGLENHHKDRFPHEFSGGQRQRIGIARALALNPRFIVCDEPIAALDVSIQAQIINLLKDLQERLRLTYLFISHDLSVVKYISTRVAVMYLGHLMELSPTKELYENPLHPYTQLLIESVLIPEPPPIKKRTQVLIKGEALSPIHSPKGCVFCNRCPKAMPICSKERPEWKEVLPNRFVACHFLAD